MDILKVILKKNEEILLEKEKSSSKCGYDWLIDDLKEMKISEIRELVSQTSGEELEFLLDGVEMNEELAAYSEEHIVGVEYKSQIALAFHPELTNDLRLHEYFISI